MPRYNEFYYNTGYYGLKSALAFSAEPLIATALRYGRVSLSYLPPTGTYTEFRIVRNQDSFPQTQEDGVVVLHSFGAPDGAPVLDSEENTSAPLVPGRFAYYRAWIRKTTTSDWVPAGDTYTLLPAPHNLSVDRNTVYSVTGAKGQTTDASVYSDPNVNPIVSTTHKRFMSLFPNVLVSETNSALDEINEDYSYTDYSGAKKNTLLSAFMSAFSFTVDEILTMTKLVAPDNSGINAGPSTILLRSHELGMGFDVDPVTSTQKKLLRNAVTIYSRKGTPRGIAALVEGITGYDSTVGVSTNMILSHEDSTFDILNWVSGDPLGNWQQNQTAMTLSMITTDTAPVIDFTGTRAIDRIYSAQIVTTATEQSISLGVQEAVTKGIPVIAGTVYNFSFYIAKNSSSSTVAPKVIWFDKNGEPLAPYSMTIGSSTTKPVTTSWARQYVTVTAPAGAVYAGLAFVFNAAGTYHLDMIQFEPELVSGSGPTIFQEARAAVIALTPVKTNWIINPSFEVNTTGWTGVATSSISTSTTTSYYGDKSMKVTANGSAAAGVVLTASVPVLGGEYYSMSAYVKDLTAMVPVKVGIDFYDVTNTLIGTTWWGTDTNLSGGSNWVRVTSSAKAPLTATSAKARILTSSTPANGAQYYVDCVQLEMTEGATDYFDGSMQAIGAQWLGTAHASTSHYYPNLSVRLARLKGEIEKYLPLDTPYYIEYTGDEISGIS